MHTPNAIVIDPSFPPAELTGAHLRTYQAIFRHPIAHNLGWHEVHALFRQLCQIEEEPNGNFKVTRNGQTLVLSMPRTKDVAETEELMSLRGFLERSATPVPVAAEGDAHWLVSINHHEARIFRSENHGTVPERIRPIQPDDPTDDHSHPEFSRGQEKPTEHNYFGPISAGLKGAGQILIVGSGTGTANEKEQFVAWLRTHHPELARRIVGVQTIDAHHITDDQLLAQARGFYAHPHQQPAPRA